MGRIVVAGLGPGDPGLVTAATLSAIETIPTRRLRTTVHPSAHLVPDATSFDGHYETGDTFDEVYRRIVGDLLADADRHGEVLYVVPGSPRVLERTVDLLEQAGERGEVDLEILPAVSFLEIAWTRLGLDPFEHGVRLVDGHRFAAEAAGERGPLLIAHCHNLRVLSDVKLSVDEGPETPVVVLQRLGLPDESIRSIAWADLDREIEPDHLTSIFVPELTTPVAAEVTALVDLVTTLRSECPWDARQTHATLRSHLVEETYEVIDALEAVGDGGIDTDPDAYADLEEELGDLLFQIVFHAVLATEAGAFGLAEIARGIHDKLRHRHPHVFPRTGLLGDATVDDADEVATNWERIKKEEKGRASVMDGIPRHLPSLAFAVKALKKAASLDLDPVDLLGPAPAGPDGSLPAGDDELGHRLLHLAASARTAELDPEAALRRAVDRLIARVTALEAEEHHP